MKVFIHTQEGMTQRDIPANDMVGCLVDDDQTIWLEDADEPLSPDLLAHEHLRDFGHLHINRCKIVLVSVSYAGRTIETDVTPSKRIRTLLQWATGPRGFDLGPAQAATHELQVCGSDEATDPTDHVGSLATDCAVCLDLVPKERFQG